MGNSFEKVSRLFPHIAQSMLLVLLQGCFKNDAIQFKRNKVLRNEDEEYQTLKVFHSTPEHTVKSHLYLSNK